MPKVVVNMQIEIGSLSCVKNFGDRPCKREQTMYMTQCLLLGIKAQQTQRKITSFLLMAKRFVAEVGMKSMASQKHHFIAIVNSLKMGFDAQCMEMRVS